MITDGKAPPRPVELLIEDGRVVPHANLQGSGEYVLHDVDQLALPYLPDPLAIAVSFTTLPGDGDTRVLDWPTDGRGSTASRCCCGSRRARGPAAVGARTRGCCGCSCPRPNT